MIKLVAPEVWAFDAEWVPDAATGRRVYPALAAMSDDDALHGMWAAGGASEEDPTPYLKTILCRVVSVSAVIRKQDKAGAVSLRLHSLPAIGESVLTEKDLLGRFLSALGKAKPQLVGFNSSSADLPILIQRAMVNQLAAPAFCARPNKPWEGVDYFARGSDHNVDLKEEVSGWGKGTPSLHELAAACGIPGKMGTSGEDVIALWRAGDIARIVQYNECDALSTYLVWLRLAHLAGHVTSGGYSDEEAQLRSILREQASQPGKGHLAKYLAEWARLSA